jgi:hypothetical protein
MIRFGTYTKYKDYDLRLVEISSFYRVIYDGSNCPFEDFVEYTKNVFYIDLLKEQILNAFSIRTYGIYKGYQFDVNQLNKDETIGIVTSDIQAYENLKLDFRDRGVYQKEVLKIELEKIWEEYSPSPLKLPMPDGLPKVRVLEFPKNY